MKEIFEIIREPERENERGLRIGIRLKMAGYETLCPMSEPCRSLQDVQVEVDRLKRELDRLLDRTKGVFEGNASDGKLGVTAEMTAGQIWRLLSEVGDDEAQRGLHRSPAHITDGLFSRRLSIRQIASTCSSPFGDQDRRPFCELNELSC